MILFPAIDIQGGKAVRLRQGRKEEATVFAANPVEVARRWQNLGAKWLHLVDLDGAFSGNAASASILGEICELVDIPVQIGGGIRSLDTAEAYLAAGATRVIIGTMALESPELFAGLCGKFPGKVGVSLDAANGRLKTRGWEQDSGQTIEDVLPRLEDAGGAFVIYTDIERDGMRAGINLRALDNLLRIAHVPVICAGGVASMADIEQLYGLFAGTLLEGVISGRALYEGSLDFQTANDWLAAKNAKNQ